MKVYLIRHGMTKFNEEKKYSGSTDVSLSENGVMELESLSNIYKNIPECELFVSGLRRTKETAEILFESKMIKGYLEFMNEMNFGDFEGFSYEELKENPIYINWIMNIRTATPNNGESMNEFEKRVLNNFIDHVIKNETDTIYVTHGGVIRLIMSKLVRSDIDFFEWETPFGKGYILEFQDDKVIDYVKI